MADDFSADTSTTGTVPGSSGAVNVRGNIETANDSDWFKFSVAVPGTFTFNLGGSRSGNGTLSDPVLTLFDGSGMAIVTNDDISSLNRDSRITRSLASGTYYLQASGYGLITGTYTLAVSDSIAADVTTTATISLGQTINDAVNYSYDQDWYAIRLVAGGLYTFSEDGGVLDNGLLRIRDATGALVASTSPADYSTTPLIRDFRPITTGTYYVSAEAQRNYADHYSVTANGFVPVANRDIDFNGDLVDDILFRNAAGTLSTWQLTTGGLVGGGGAIGNPGANFRVIGTGDFNGDEKADVLFRGRDGTIASWQMTGTAITGGGTIGNPGAAFAAVGTGDFNADGRTDVLFYNGLTGAYATWDLNGTAIVGGGTIGTLGKAFVYKATGDFNGDGRSDILFQDANGSYAIWALNDTAIVSGSGTIGNPGAGYFFKGVGDFNGDGKSDILFENANGSYATWNLNGLSIIGRGGSPYAPAGGGTLGTPPAGYTFASIDDYNGDGKADIIFSTPTGGKYVWIMNNITRSDQYLIGDPGGSFVQVVGHAASNFGTVVFQDTLSATVASWQVGQNTIVGGGTFGRPGTAFTAIATGDFAGTGETDVLFRNDDGSYATWTTNGSSLIGGGTIGTPGFNDEFMAAADFNGDGRTDILFQNTHTTGAYALWDMTGATITGGGTIGTAANYAFAATGDINGDGRADIIFRDANGGYAAWMMNDTAITGGGTIGNPNGNGVGWTLKGMGDFNGDGKADILFLGTNGTYATWDLDGISIVGGGNLGNPGGSFQLAKIVDLNQDGKSDLLFVDGSGNYASWLISDTSIIGGGNLGTVSSNFHVV